MDEYDVCLISYDFLVGLSAAQPNTSNCRCWVSLQFYPTYLFRYARAVDSFKTYEEIFSLCQHYLQCLNLNLKI